MLETSNNIEKTKPGGTFKPSDSDLLYEMYRADKKPLISKETVEQNPTPFKSPAAPNGPSEGQKEEEKEEGPKPPGVLDEPEEIVEEPLPSEPRDKEKEQPTQEAKKEADDYPMQPIELGDLLKDMAPKIAAPDGLDGTEFDELSETQQNDFKKLATQIIEAAASKKTIEDLNVKEILNVLHSLNSRLKVKFKLVRAYVENPNITSNDEEIMTYVWGVKDEQAKGKSIDQALSNVWGNEVLHQMVHHVKNEVLRREDEKKEQEGGESEE